MAAHHGMSHLPEYIIWKAMIKRCYNPKNKRFFYYGGRGITVCNEWRASFLAFYQDVGPRPDKKLSLDRINNMAGYAKDNVRWATMTEQCNNRRSNTLFTHNGQTLTIAQWAKQLGLSYAGMRKRFLHMSVERAITHPLRFYKPRQRVSL